MARAPEERLRTQEQLRVSCPSSFVIERDDKGGGQLSIRGERGVENGHNNWYEPYGYNGMEVLLLFAKLVCMFSLMYDIA
jgi:hypothetical protein